MSRESVAFNIKDPQPSVFGERSRLARQEPTTSEVLGAFIEEAFQGEGTLVQDIAASNIRKQERRGEPITQKTWKESNNFREGLSWYEGMTKKSAETLAKIEDERNERQNIFDRASGIQKGFGIGAQLVTGIFEPKNFHSGQIAAIATAGIGSAAPTIGRLVSTKTVRGAATRGAVEGTLAAGVTEISSQESSAIVQGDYTMADTLMNFGLSMVLGAGLGAGAKGLEQRARGKRLEEIKAFRADRAIATKEFDTALGQMTQGQRVDVEAVAEVEGANNVPQITTLSKARLEEFPDIQQLGKNKFEARFNDEQGLLSGARGVGKTANEAAENLVIQYRNPNVAIRAEVSEELVGQIIESNQLKAELQNITSDEYYQRQLIEKKLPVNVLAGLEERIKNIKQQRVTERSKLSGKKLEKKRRLFDVETKRQLAPLEAELKSFRALNINDQLAEISQVIKQKTQQLRGQISKLESNIKATQIENARLSTQYQRFQKSLETNANSSAYDDVTPKSVVDSLELAQQSDDKIFQDNLQFAQEQAQEMLDQGQLTDADIKNLEKLENIDTEMEIYDNIYSNLKNCLIR